jgi:hypothetical protein
MNKIKIILIIIFTMLIFSCKNEKKNIEETNVEEISIDMSDISKVNLNDLFEKIELTPLETTNTESLIGSINQMIYVKDKYFIFKDQMQQILVFDNTGTFVANSSKRFGAGPGEYTIALYMIYNPFTEDIDVLTPQNQIYVYDTTFNYKGNIKLHINHPENGSYGMIHYIFPISKSEYICIPPTIYEEYNTLYFYNWQEEKVVKKIVFEDIYGGVTQTINPVRYTDSTNYFNPALTTYTGYRVDIEGYNLEPFVRLDFGKEKINAHSLKNFKTIEDIRDYLIQSNYPIPTLNLFNDNYLICNVLKKVDLYTFFYNKNTKQRYLLKEMTNDNYKIPDFYAIEENVLISIIHPYQLVEYVDLNLLSKDEKDKLLKIKEGDNPVVVKYFLR